MTSLVTVKKEVEKLRERVAVKPKDVVTVCMWVPDGKDPEYNGGPIRIKALNKGELNGALR